MGAANSANLFENRNLGREVELTINGKQYIVSDNIPADTSLNTYIREYAHLKGTKFMCLEGGCGTCIVSVSSVHPATGKTITYAVNSCLVPIFACHKWCIITVEGLGTKKTGYNKIVKRLAAANGTQCGYCSPGMVMNMYSLLEKNPKITMKEVENSFGGNICRCTGYRPIMEAFKSLASDAPVELKKKLTDIEDLMECTKNGCSTSSPNPCSKPCAENKGLHFQLQGGSSWFRPADKKEVFEVLDMIGGKSYRFLAGNTGPGVYRNKSEPEVYIDLNGVPELHKVEVRSDGIFIGANVNLTEAMDLFYKLAEEQPAKFKYLRTLGDHIDLIANVPVRNTGTLGGNLFMKHTHHDFPSDVFLFLEMVNAQLLIADSMGSENQIGLIEFLQTDMTRKFILTILLPILDNNMFVTRSYKIMPRAQNAHAYVNAGFMFKLDKKSHTVLEKPNIIFGGIKPEFIHATKLEDYLKGMKLINKTTLKGALEILESELNPDHVLPDASPEYRKGLALSLFYKFVLSVAPDEVQEKYRSGGTLLKRPVTSASQDFETDSTLWPLNKPMAKVEGLIQCSGEAEYVNDIPQIPGQLWAQLVLCDRAGAVIAQINPEEALKLDGVVAFLSAEDIPGKNNYYPPDIYMKKDDELIFSSGRTNYAGEPVGVIVAESHHLAIKAADLVKIEYSDQRKPKINVRDIVKNDKDRLTEFWKKIEPKGRGKNIKYEIKGTWDIKGQYHYTMETQSCLAIPKDTEIDLYPATQAPSQVQEIVSEALKIPQNNINVYIRRVGGGYGMKLSRSVHTAAVTALAANHLQRPVRMVLQMERNMEFVGKRFPIFNDYEVGVDENGTIQYLTSQIYQDSGYADNDNPLFTTMEHVINGYNPSTWDIRSYSVKTDSAGNTFCRGPAALEGICIIENIMEHIANVTGKDPVDVRISNLKREDNPLPALIEELIKMSDYRNREKQIVEFNKMNRWKKRGIALVPMLYPIGYFGCFNGLVSIFAQDGSVSITHGAVEMGQGVNTKVVQVAAQILGIDTWNISVKTTNINISPNVCQTGGSIGSECACYAVKVACEELNKRLEPVKKELGDKASWVEITQKAFNLNINLSASHMQAPSELKGYNSYGVTALEVEVDVLTGQYQTLRVDLLQDAGISLSPEIDVGQVEGAFVMGLGYYTCEELVYESETGKLLTNRTWNYKPPGAKDIPIDFRITLRKNAPNPFGVLRSKATGEPPICMSCVVLFAIRNALESARKDTGLKQELWFNLEQPYTAEKIWLGTLTKKDSFDL